MDQPIEVPDEVIAEVHRHKEAIAAEHNFDLNALLSGLRKRQKVHPRLVSRNTKGEQDGAAQPATALESKPEGILKANPESDVRYQ